MKIVVDKKHPFVSAMISAMIPLPTTNIVLKKKSGERPHGITCVQLSERSCPGLFIPNVRISHVR